MGVGWRAAFVVVAGCALLGALAVPPLPRTAAPVDAEADEDEAEAAEPLREALAHALRNRRLLAWTVGTSLCTLLDEILLVLAALHLAARHGADPAERALVLGALMVGSALGVVLVQRLLAFVAPLPLLAAQSAVCASTYLGWIFAPSMAASAVLATLVGLTVSGQYPLAKAQAYRAAPGRAGSVNALGALLAPLDVVVPLALALLVDHASVTVALAVLVLQPVGLLILALTCTPRRSRP